MHCTSDNNIIIFASCVCNYTLCIMMQTDIKKLSLKVQVEVAPPVINVSLKASTDEAKVCIQYE